MSFGSFNDQEDEPMAEINVTPLVDVMLVLLIVFMITMPVLTHSIPLQLPTASSDKPTEEKTEPLRLSINIDGQYFLGEKEYTLDQLRLEFKHAHDKNKDVILAISADKAVEYQKVTDALGAAQEVGIDKIGFVTEINN